MAGTLKRAKLQSVGTSATALTTGTETGPASGKVWNIPRLYVANRTAADVTAHVSHKTSATDTYLCWTRTVKAYDTQLFEHLVLLAGDSITITSSAASSLDVFGSILEEDA
jgi:hypothetical protein